MLTFQQFVIEAKVKEVCPRVLPYQGKTGCIELGWEGPNIAIVGERFVELMLLFFFIGET
jgi:hypothetical protein